MRLFPVIVAALFLPACAADLALEAATGKPMSFVQSITGVDEARQDPNGPTRVCLSAIGSFHPWYELWHYDRPERAHVFFDVTLPEDPSVPVRVRNEALHYLGNRKCECSGGTPWAWKLLQVELVGAADAPAADQRLAFRDGERVVGTVEFAPLEPGHPLAWPLVPLGFVTDTVFVTAGVAAYTPIAVLFIWLPKGIYRLATGHSFVPETDPCEIPKEPSTRVE